MTASVAVGIDLGATHVKAVAVDVQKNVLGRIVWPLIDKTPDGVINLIVSVVGAVLDTSSLDHAALLGVGVGAPGPLNHETGCIINSVNLTGWVNVPLRDHLKKKLHVQVILENDGNTAALGECWSGSGKGVSHLVMLTLGTGVGAGVIIDQRIHHGFHGNAGEIGHTVVEIDGLPCPCGQSGCLEQYASASGVARRVVTAMQEGQPSSLRATFDSNQPIDAKIVASEAQAGDKLCNKIWNDACRYLAITCINIQHTLNPEIIIFGGGMSLAESFLIDRVREHFVRDKWRQNDDVPKIMLGKLGYDAGAIGAASMILESPLELAHESAASNSPP